MQAALGVDVSKATLAVSLVRRGAARAEWTTSVANEPQAITAFLAGLTTACPVALEPTGPYGAELVSQARARGWTVLVAEPRGARSFLRSRPARAKTDALDSVGLARYALSEELRPYYVKSAAVAQLDELQAVRRRLSAMLASLRQHRNAVAHVREEFAPTIAFLANEIQRLDHAIAGVVGASAIADLVARLDGVPGVGPVTATAVANCLAARGFEHPDKFVAFVGLDLKVNDSGTRRGRHSLSHRGDAELRRLLYLAAQANARCKVSPFKDQYHRELEKGLPPTAALCAVARKLAKVLWALWRHGGPFEAARVGQTEAIHGKTP